MEARQKIVNLLCWASIASTFLMATPVYAAEATPDSQKVQTHAEHSPLNQSYKVRGWNIPRFYYYEYYHLFSDYPWVVRVSYNTILCCILGFLFVIVFMVIDVYRHNRNERFYLKIQKRYLEKMKQICHPETENLPIEEIQKRMNYQPRKWHDWQMRIWARVLIDVSQFTNTFHPHLTNIQRIMQLIGLTDFAEHSLIMGSRRRKVRVLQGVRLTNMKLPDSIVTRLVNDNHADLRKAARTYYMLTAKDDPFMFFEEQGETAGWTSKSDFTIWDRIEIHEILSKRKEGGKSLPKFIPILQGSHNYNMTIFMMQETTYWGSEKEFKFLTNYFESENFIYRQKAFECMGLRRYTKAEETMKNLFYKQTETLRRAILNALLDINTGKSISFYADVYRTPSSDYTRRTALRCLWLSGAKGRAVFEQLKVKAEEKDLILFEHVENPIINADDL